MVVTDRLMSPMTPVAWSSANSSMITISQTRNRNTDSAADSLNTVHGLTLRN